MLSERVYTDISPVSAKMSIAGNARVSVYSPYSVCEHPDCMVKSLVPVTEVWDCIENILVIISERESVLLYARTWAGYYARPR